MGKISSVKRSNTFSRAYKVGKSAVSKHLAVYVLKKKKGGEYAQSSLGLTVSKKFGRAVDRTRARRIMREAYRALQPDIRCGYDIIAVARNAMLGSKTQEIVPDMRYCFEKLGIIEMSGDAD